MFDLQFNMTTELKIKKKNAGFHKICPGNLSEPTFNWSLKKNFVIIILQNKRQNYRQYVKMQTKYSSKIQIMQAIQRLGCIRQREMPPGPRYRAGLTHFR